MVLWGFLSDYTGSRFAFVIGPLVRVDSTLQGGRAMSTCVMKSPGDYANDGMADLRTCSQRHPGVLAGQRGAQGIRLFDVRSAAYDCGDVGFDHHPRLVTVLNGTSSPTAPQVHVGQRSLRRRQRRAGLCD